MTDSTAAIPGHSERLTALLRRAVDVEPAEIVALAGSFAFFFCVLCSYYILRPLRDEMASALGRDQLDVLLAVIFVIMLAMVPVFGWLMANLARARVLPAIYAFFIANIFVFWVLMSSATKPSPVVAGAFYVWINVYVMFVVSLFWSFMSEVWNSAQAKRLYGFISVGGTVGGLCGPLLVQALVSLMGRTNLILLSAVFLGLALSISIALRKRMAASGSVDQTAAVPKQTTATLIDGALNVWRQPYLFRIALWVLAANVIGMFFYLEQSHIVGAAITDRDARVVLFSRIETAVSLLTIVLQTFVTGGLIKRIGVGATAAIVPSTAVIGLLLFAVAPTFVVIVGIMIMQRSIGYGVANPATRTLYTVVTPVELV